MSSRITGSEMATAGLLGAIFGGGILLILVFFVFGPIFTIWALNLIFGLSIPLNFWTWLSVFWLHMVINSRSSSVSSSSS